MKKKGVSPVIAVVLMVAVAVALAVIIYAWASGYITGETGKASSTTSYGLISEEKRLSTDSTEYLVFARNTSIPVENATTAFDVYVDGLIYAGTVALTEITSVAGGNANSWEKGEVWEFTLTGTPASGVWRSGTVIKIVHKISGYELVVVIP